METKVSLPLDEFLNTGFIFSCPNHPGSLWLGWGLTARSSASSLNFSKTPVSIYAPDFFLKDSNTWWHFSGMMQISLEDLEQILRSHQRLHQKESSGYDQPIQWQEPSFSQFQQTFEALQLQIQQGSLKKGVPYVFDVGVGEVTPEARLVWLTHAVSSIRQTPLYLYGVWDTQEGVIGATPEILIEQKSSQEFGTVALAGTQVRAQVAQDLEGERVSLLHDPKEREEHRIVIEGIQARLSGLAELSVGETKELHLPSLIHLITPIGIHLKEKMKDEQIQPLEKLIQLLHPTPALGAYPREQGWQWLLELEAIQSRGRFGAPFGIVLHETQQSHSLVGIRNIQWKAQEVRIGAGCGVVAASRLEREWRELQGKLKSIRQIFGLTQSQRGN